TYYGIPFSSTLPEDNSVGTCNIGIEAFSPSILNVWFSRKLESCVILFINLKCNVLGFSSSISSFFILLGVIIVGLTKSTASL
uniref:Ovule protein n=1 Tax=Strongyloides papillosus TaxID=174720 RepID=A0A0N5CDX4_STREA